MMGPFVLAWLTGEGILTYRWVKAGAPPTPGALFAASGIFVMLAVLAQYPPAKNTATVFAWAVDLAVLIQSMQPVQDTGWPPTPIDDATVLLPPGVAAAAKGTTVA